MGDSSCAILIILAITLLVAGLAGAYSSYNESSLALTKIASNNTAMLGSDNTFTSTVLSIPCKITPLSNVPKDMRVVFEIAETTTLHNVTRMLQAQCSYVYAFGENYSSTLVIMKLTGSTLEKASILEPPLSANIPYDYSYSVSGGVVYAIIHPADATEWIIVTIIGALLVIGALIECTQ